MGLFSRRSKDADNVALAAARARLSSADVDQIRFLLTTKKTLFAVKYVKERTDIDLHQATRPGRGDPPRPLRPTDQRHPRTTGARHQPRRAHPGPEGSR